MVTLRRTVQSDSERYGGYTTRFNSNHNSYDTFRSRQDEKDEQFDDAYVGRNYQGTVAISSQRERYYPSERAQEPMRTGLNAKGKLLIALYVLVVALFVGLIIANSASITAVTGQVSQQAKTLETSEAAYFAGNADIKASTEQTMLLKATELGYANPDEAEVGTYELLLQNAPVSYDTQSSWFDKTCDWIGEVVGG